MDVHLGVKSFICHIFSYIDIERYLGLNNKHRFSQCILCWGLRCGIEVPKSFLLSLEAWRGVRYTFKIDAFACGTPLQLSVSAWKGSLGYILNVRCDFASCILCTRCGYPFVFPSIWLWLSTLLDDSWRSLKGIRYPTLPDFAKLPW